MKDNVVVITGASKGIGAELARQLASRGAILAHAARDRPALEQVAAECVARGARAEIFVTDVAVVDDCRKLVERTRRLRPHRHPRQQRRRHHVRALRGHPRHGNP